MFIGGQEQRHELLVLARKQNARRHVLVGQAGDPLVGMAADIDYVGTFTIAGGAPGTFEVSFDGKIDAFPAYDCYAHCNGVTKEIFKSSPPPGNTVADLLGGASRPVSGRVSFA